MLIQGCSFPSIAFIRSYRCFQFNGLKVQPFCLQPISLAPEIQPDGILLRALLANRRQRLKRMSLDSKALFGNGRARNRMEEKMAKLRDSINKLLEREVNGEDLDDVFDWVDEDKDEE